MAFDPSTATLLDEAPDKKKNGFDPSTAQPIDEPPVPPEIAQSEAQQAIERNSTGSLSDVRSMLDSAMKVPGKAALAASSIFHPGGPVLPHWPTDEEVQTPVLSPELARAMAKAPFLTSGINQATEGPAAAIKGTLEGAGDVVSGLTTPENAALLGLAPGGKVAQRLVAGVFMGQSIMGTPEQWQALQEAKTTAEKFRIGTEMGLSLALPAAGMFHAKAGEVPKEGGRSPESVPVVEPRQQSAGTESPQDASISASEKSPSSLVTETARLPEQPVEPRQAQSDVNTPPVPDSSLKEPQAVPVDVQGQTARFVPSTEWQEVPPGTVLPNGGEYRMDQKSGKNYARWKPENLPSSEVRPQSPPSESARTAETSQEVSRQSGQLDTSVESQLPSDITRRGQSDPQVETTPTSEEPSRVGIAHSYGEERFPGEIDRGEGTNVETQVARGRDLLNRGVDPGQIVRRVEKTGRISGDDMAVLRAQLETLQHTSDTAAEAARTNPDPVLQRAAEQAMQNELAWRKTIKPAATAFHEIGMTLQGQAEVNYGTFAGLRRAAVDLHGKDVNPAQAATLKEVANRVRRENQLATESLQRATTQVEQTFGRKAPARSVEQLRNDLANRLRELTPC